MTVHPALDLQHRIAANASAAFNRLAGLEIIGATDGAAEIRMRSNDDFTRCTGYPYRNDCSPA